MAQTNGNGAHTNGANGSNGSSYSSKPGLATSLPATSIISEWVASSTSNPSQHLTPSMRTKLSELLLDHIGITAAAAHSSASTPPIVAAMTSLTPPTTSPACTVLTRGSRYPPHIASLLNATFAHSLDFDDTHAGGTLHPGVTTIATALACTQSLPSPPSLDTFLLALSIGYELTCRLGLELSYEAYARGFHNTATAGVFGCVATIAVLKSLSKDVIENAFGLAGSRAAGSMQYLDNGSHNKRLHPGFACHDAFVCVALAEQGVVGASRIVEGKMGFLHAYSPNEKMDLNRLVGGLGEKWIFPETGLKPFPACRMTHGVVEMASKLGAGRRKGGKEMVKVKEAEDVKCVEIRVRSPNMSLVGDPLPNKVHPRSEVDGQFSAYFQFANAYLYGMDSGVEAYKKLDDDAIHALSDKIKCVVDDEDPDIGGGMGAKILIQWQDAKKEETSMKYPLGEEQHPFTSDKVEGKFKGCMVPVYGEERTEEVLKAVTALGEGKGGRDCGVQQLMEMIA